MDLGTLAAGADTVLTGGVLGTLGGLLGRGLSILEKERAAKIAERLSAQEHRQALEKAERGAQQSAAQALIDGSFAGLQATVQDQQAAVGRASQWVVDLNALTRPALTVVLGGATVAMAWVSSANPHLGSLIALTTMAVTWWFGDRQSNLRAGR